MTDLNRHLERWLHEGIVSAEQAELMRQSLVADSAEPDGRHEPERRIPLVTEILGYVGAALAVWAVMFMAMEFWEKLNDWTQASLFAGLSLVLFVAGAALLDALEPAIKRLSAVLWSASVVSLGGMVFIISDAVAGYDEPLTWSLIGSIAALAAGFMLWRQESTTQHVTLFAATIIAIASLLALGPNPDFFFYGLVVWVFGLVWAAASRFGLLRPRDPGMVLGSLSMLVGAQMAVDDSGLSTAGVLLGLATAGLLAGAGIVLREKLTITLGGIGIFWFIPQAMFHFFGEAMGAMFGLLISGVLLIGLATWFARHKEVL